MAIGEIESKGFAPLFVVPDHVLARLAAMVAACSLACTGAKATTEYPQNRSA